MNNKRPSFDVEQRSAVWGSKHTSKAGRTSPIICINPGGDFARTDKIFPATGKAILNNLDEFLELLKEQQRIMAAVSPSKDDSSDEQEEAPAQDDEPAEETARPTKKFKKPRR